MAFSPARRLWLAGVLVAAACYSPTLPLPPPSRPEITQTETGAYRIRGGVLPDAQVFALNERNGIINGQQVGPDAHYDIVLEDGRTDDVIQLWYQRGLDLSPTTVFALPAPERVPGAGGEGGAAP